MAEKELRWETLEYKYKEKSPDWFWAVGIIAVSLAVTSILFRNILFAVFILIGAFALALYSQRRPQKVNVVLGQRGVFINDRLRTYHELDSFWLEDRDGNPRILFKSQQLTSPFLIIPIEGIRSDTIREFLLNHLEEEEHTEPLSQKILEFLGF